ncbi:hypothetical protein GGR56DRAFT_155799 [Xylariaceae sp. FL0804]|nr:hypothetical protein GGR56DRAFT_155799 [Xylariaceae sp. FL0804]
MRASPRIRLANRWYCVMISVGLPILPRTSYAWLALHPIRRYLDLLAFRDVQHCLAPDAPVRLTYTLLDKLPFSDERFLEVVSGQRSHCNPTHQN